MSEAQKPGRGQLERSGIITSPLDIFELDIIDFDRLNGTWRNNKRHALETIFSRMGNICSYEIWHISDFWEAPKIDGLPSWWHVGKTHENIGVALRNWFYWNHPQGWLDLGDEPDFQGGYKKKSLDFWGDIGRVSASTFSLTHTHVKSGREWISVEAALHGAKMTMIKWHKDMKLYI